MRLDAALEALSEDGDGFAISACFGSVFIPSEAADVVSAMRIADQRLYAQKRAGKERRQPRLVLVDADPTLPGRRGRDWGAA